MSGNLFTTLIFIWFTLAVSARHAQDEDFICDKTANSVLWKMKRSPAVYFFGTIHVPHTRVWNYIPDNSKKAFYSSDNVVFELDLANKNTIRKLNRYQLLPRGTRLQQVLPYDLYRRVKQHFDVVKESLPGWIFPGQKVSEMRKKEIFASIVGNWKRKKPIWVMLMIKSLTEAEMKSHGVLVFDHYLALQAERLGKHVGAIESVDEQCQPLDGLNDTQVFIALNHTLMIQERFDQGQVQDFFSSDDLIHQYICGELNLVKSNNKSNQVRLLNSSLTLKRRSMSRDEVETDVELYLENELIYRRNKRMVKRIKILLDAKSNKSFFFAFGAGHFLGNNSVIELLRKDGYSIDHIKAKTFKRRSFKKIRKHSHSDSFSAWLQVQAWADDVEQHGFRNQKRFGKRRLHSHPSRRNKLTTRNNHKVHRKRNLSMNVEERSFNQTSSSANKEHGGLFTRYSHTFAGKTRSPLRVVDLKLKRSSSHFDGYKQSSGKSTIYFDSTKKSKRTKPKLRRRRKYHRKPTSNKISYSFSSPEKGLSVEIWEELLPKKIKRYNSNSSPMHQGQVLLCVFMAMISALTVQVNASYWFNALKLDTSKGHADAYESKRTSVNKQHSFYAKKAKDFVLKV